MSEFRRVLLSRRTLLYLLIAVLLGAIFFLYDCGSDKAITLTGEELSAYISGYPEFLQSVQDNADNYNTIAALSGGFSAENIRKTAQDYAALTGVQPVLGGNTMLQSRHPERGTDAELPSDGGNKGFVLLSGYVTGDIIIIAVTLLVAASFTEERKKGLVTLIRSTKNGRRLLSVQRTGIIVITALVTSIFIHLACFAVAELSCGDMSVLRPIQSVPEFSLCPFRITMLDYLVYSVLMKALAAAVCGLLLYLISSIMESVIAFAICGAGLVMEYIFYGAILPTDRLAGLKFCNIAAVLRTDVFFSEYCNLNIFGNAVGFLPCALAVTVFLFVLLCGLCVMLTSGGGAGLSFGSKLIERVSSFISRKTPSMPLPMWEAKKVFINQKGAIILAVIIYIAVSSAFQYRYVLPSYTRSEEKYYQKYTGEMTAELQTEMNEDFDKLQADFDALVAEYLQKLEANGGLHDDELMKMYNRLMDMAEDLEALEMLIGTVDRGLAYTAETGITVHLIKPKLYELLLLRDTATTNKNALYIMLAIVGIFAGICANENRCNMNSALHSSLRGRGRLTAIKLSVIGVTSMLVTAAVFAPQVLLIGAEGYNDLEVAAQSLEFLRFVPFEISILGYLIEMFIVRMLAAFAVGAAVMLISRYCGSTITAVCVSAAILIVPAVLAGTGVLPVPSAADLIGFCVL